LTDLTWRTDAASLLRLFAQELHAYAVAGDR
jgi:hypothetical protein